MLVSLLKIVFFFKKSIQKNIYTRKSFKFNRISLMNMNKPNK